LLRLLASRTRIRSNRDSCSGSLENRKADARFLFGAPFGLAPESTAVTLKRMKEAARRRSPVQSPAADAVEWSDVLALMADLKRTARGLLAKEGNAGSVHTTQLVNSALLKLCPKKRDWHDVAWQDREAFFKDAYFAMRRVLIDHARGRKRRRRVQVGGFESALVAPLIAGGALDLDRLADHAASRQELAEAIANALEALERDYPKQRLAEIVQHRAFSGLGQAEIGRLLDISDRTVRTREALAYSLLRHALEDFFPAKTKPHSSP
jgi:RNA polymerase sigma-70 factor, ECF subfamily